MMRVPPPIVNHFSKDHTVYLTMWEIPYSSIFSLLIGNPRSWAPLQQTNYAIYLSVNRRRRCCCRFPSSSSSPSFF